MRRWRTWAAWACALAPVLAGAAPFQFEVLSVSGDWLVLRENILAAASDTAACGYPGLDPSEFVGSSVHFVRLSPEAARGRATAPAQPESTIAVHAPQRGGAACTSAAETRQRWAEVAMRAQDLGITMPGAPPVPRVFGGVVPAARCALLGGKADAARPPCRSVLRPSLHGMPFRIAVALSAVPEAGDERTCQFVGHRMVAVLQVAGADFGRIGRPAPGGVVEHFDCRPQQFQPMRLYDLGDVAALLVAFRGANIADRSEHPFVVVFPTRPAP